MSPTKTSPEYRVVQQLAQIKYTSATKFDEDRMGWIPDFCLAYINKEWQHLLLNNCQIAEHKDTLYIGQKMLCPRPPEDHCQDLATFASGQLECCQRGSLLYLGSVLIRAILTTLGKCIIQIELAISIDRITLLVWLRAFSLIHIKTGGKGAGRVASRAFQHEDKQPAFHPCIEYQLYWYPYSHGF
jgi:hypothetical protein